MEALNGLTGDLAGRYYRLSEMTEKEQQQLIDVSQCSSWPATVGAHRAEPLPRHCLSRRLYPPFPALPPCGTRTPFPSEATLQCRGCSRCCSALPSQGRMELAEHIPSSSQPPLALAPCPCLCPGEGRLVGHGPCPTSPWYRVGCAPAAFCLPGQEGRDSCTQVEMASELALPGTAVVHHLHGKLGPVRQGALAPAMQPWRAHTLCLPPGPLPLRQAGVPAPDGSRNGPGLARRPRDLVRICPGIRESGGQKGRGCFFSIWLPQPHHPHSPVLTAPQTPAHVAPAPRAVLILGSVA